MNMETAAPDDHMGRCQVVQDSCRLVGVCWRDCDVQNATCTCMVRVSMLEEVELAVHNATMQPRRQQECVH